MDNQEILAAIHKIDKELASHAATVVTEISNIKTSIMGNYEELSREVDEIRRETMTNKAELAATQEFQQSSLRQQKLLMWIVVGFLGLFEVGFVAWELLSNR